MAGPDCVEGAWVAAELADRTLGDLLAAVVAGVEVGGYLRRWLADANERHGLHRDNGQETAAGTLANEPA